MMDCKSKYKTWLQLANDREVQASLRGMTDEDIKNAFTKDLSFGTAGLRGIMTAGSDRMNVYTVHRATKGLAKYMKARGLKSCVITYDSRINSRLFSEITAATLIRDGIETYLTKDCMPTPFLSFAVRYLNCDMGVNVTASHNPSNYNGYKVYDESGCQLTDKAALQLTDYIEDADMFESPLPQFSACRDRVKTVPDQVEEAYVTACLSQQINDAKGVSVTYTPLNGVGYKIVPEVLRRAGVEDLSIVPEQSMPDGNFTTCPYPNPEKSQALSLAVALAQKVNSDVVIATDPDSDRLGVAARKGDGFVQLSGNEVGVILCDYILSQLAVKGKLPPAPVVVKTIVTTKMVDSIAAKYGAKTRDVLTGFKYIGDVINKLEAVGQTDSFVFGFEESCGYLKGSHARDKDGVIAAMLVVECAAYCKKRGVTLTDYLDELYAEHGNYLLETYSYRFEGVDGSKVKEKLLAELRTNPVRKLAQSNITKTIDYLTQTDMDLPKSDVMQFTAEDGSRLIVRPSGTEPLVKCYVTVQGNVAENADKMKKIKAQTDGLFGGKS